MALTMGMEIRGSNESDFMLRYEAAGKKYLLLVEDFYLSTLRLRPVERLRIRIEKLLMSTITYPIINRKLYETILFRYFCVCACACVRACVRVCVCVCVRACVRSM